MNKIQATLKQAQDRTGIKRRPKFVLKERINIFMNGGIESFVFSEIVIGKTFIRQELKV